MGDLTTCVLSNAERCCRPCDSLPPRESNLANPFCIDASSDEIRRKKVQEWLAMERGKRKRQPDGNIDFDSWDAADLVRAVLGEPHDGNALEILAADIGKTLVDKVELAPPEDGQTGSDIPACHDGESEQRSDGETEEQRDTETDATGDSDANFPPSHPLSVSPSCGSPLTATTTMTTCAPSAVSPQTPTSKRLPSELHPAKTATPANSPAMPSDLRPLYDKMVHLYQMQAQGLPFLLHFTPEEESQLCRLPPIFLKDS